jgi:predicted phosphodiesterase
LENSAVRVLGRLIGLPVLLALAAMLAASPQAPATSPFFFVQMSDPQFGMFTKDADFAQETLNFELALETMNRWRPAFVVVTGDLVNKPGDAAQMAEYDRIRGQIRSSIPVHDVTGNHDVGNAPTPATLAAWRARYGKDYYAFRHKSIYGIVLNSSLIHTPDEAPDELAAQDAWLTAELETARTSGAPHRIVFQHHPWFLQTADEPDGYFNVPRVRRAPLLTRFHDAGVRTLVSCHYHQNAVARDGDIEAVTTGAVGRPLGGSSSGFRVFHVTDAGITHRYFDLGSIPSSLNPARGLGAPARGAAPGRGR